MGAWMRTGGLRLLNRAVCIFTYIFCALRRAHQLRSTCTFLKLTTGVPRSTIPHRGALRCARYYTPHFKWGDVCTALVLILITHRSETCSDRYRPTLHT